MKYTITDYSFKIIPSMRSVSNFNLFKLCYFNTSWYKNWVFFRRQNSTHKYVKTSYTLVKEMICRFNTYIFNLFSLLSWRQINHKHYITVWVDLTIINPIGIGPTIVIQARFKLLSNLKKIVVLNLGISCTFKKMF